ncbi:hypothetical protein C0995_003846 [Termitomyces sp. Mi166|nr:hypothetical protein C0995_003846 [Termitomyces sp. Mi166\
MSPKDTTTITETRNSRRSRLDTGTTRPRVTNTVHDESISRSTSRRRTRSKSSEHETQPVAQRSTSVPYSFGTPASSLASPIRDTNFISLPMKPELDAVLRNIVENMEIINKKDRADLARILALKTAAIKLHAQAEGLRAILRAEKSARERLENYVSTWRPEQPSWSLLDVWEGEFNVQAFEDGEFVLNHLERPLELDSEDEGDAIWLAFSSESWLFVIPMLDIQSQCAMSSSCGTITPDQPWPRAIKNIRRSSQKRPREDTGDTEEEGRYQRRSQSQEIITDNEHTAKYVA